MTIKVWHDKPPREGYLWERSPWFPNGRPIDLKQYEVDDEELISEWNRQGCQWAEANPPNEQEEQWIEEPTVRENAGGEWWWLDGQPEPVRVISKYGRAYGYVGIKGKGCPCHRMGNRWRRVVHPATGKHAKE